MRIPIHEVAQRAVTYSVTDLRAAGAQGVHESVFRAYGILGVVKQLLAEGVSATVIRALIYEMESGPEWIKDNQVAE